MIAPLDIHPSLEQRLDAFGMPRSPRATIVPGLLFGADLAPDELVELRCSTCSRRDNWHYWPHRGIIVCRCTLRAVLEQAPLP